MPPRKTYATNISGEITYPMTIYRHISNMSNYSLNMFGEGFKNEQETVYGWKQMVDFWLVLLHPLIEKDSPFARSIIRYGHFEGEFIPELASLSRLNRKASVLMDITAATGVIKLDRDWYSDDE